LEAFRRSRGGGSGIEYLLFYSQFAQGFLILDMVCLCGLQSQWQKWFHLPVEVL
jgi:hypothetical protein